MIFDHKGKREQYFYAFHSDLQIIQQKFGIFLEIKSQKEQKSVINKKSFPNLIFLIRTRFERDFDIRNDLENQKVVFF